MPYQKHNDLYPHLKMTLELIGFFDPLPHSLLK